MQKNVESLTQFISDPFLMAGQMMSKNTPRSSANYTNRIGISVRKCDSSDLIFKIIMEIQVQGNLTTVLKVVSQIVMTLFPEAASGTALQKRCLYKFCKIHRKTPVSVFLFYKNWKRASNTGIFLWIQRNFL